MQGGVHDDGLLSKFRIEAREMKMPPFKTLNEGVFLGH